jgi:hypothetical protein
MQMKTFAIVPIVLGLTAAGVRAENAPATPAPAPAIATPSTPAPAVASTAPVANQTIYAPRLPSATELANAAATQGIAIERIEQTPTQVLVVYKYANGQNNTVAYQLLPAATPNVAATPAVAAPPQRVVVYAPPPRVVYYDYAPYYYPRYYYPPVSLSFGFGYGFGHGFRGGFHHRR